MAIDLAALERAAAGDPDAKVAVKKRWLTEVRRELGELERLRRRHAMNDRLADIGERLMGLGRRT